MLVIGHRGAKGLAPENTLSSLKAAIAAGARMLEVDLRKRRDGTPVLAHDADPSGAYAGAVELSTALNAVTLPVNLELKEPGLARAVLSAIRGFPNEVLISSSSLPALEQVRALDGSVQLGLVIPLKRAHYLLAARTLARKLDLYSFHPRLALTNRLTAKWLKSTGRQVYVWTVNRMQDMRRLADLKIDGIFTDYPNQLK